jgi:hypothetical protein
MRRTAFAERTDEARNAYRIVLEPQRKKPVVKPRRRWQKNVEELKELECKCVDWFCRPQGRVQWQSLEWVHGNGFTVSIKTRALVLRPKLHVSHAGILVVRWEIRSIYYVKSIPSLLWYVPLSQTRAWYRVMCVVYSRTAPFQSCSWDAGSRF